MRVILTLLSKDFANLRRNRAAFVLSFVVPVLIISIVGSVFGLRPFGLGAKDGGPAGIPLAVVNQSANPAAAHLVTALQAEKSFRVVTEFTNPDKTTRPLTEADLRPMIHDRQVSYAVVIPEDLIAENRFGLHLKVLSDPRNDIESQTVNGLLQKTIFSSAPQLLGQMLQTRAKGFVGADRMERFNQVLADNIAGTFGGDPAKIGQDILQGNFTALGFGATGTGTGAAASADEGMLSKLVKIDSEQVVGKEVKSPAATRLIGGYAVMFLLFALSNSSAAFFDEKNTGVFQRVLSGPVSRAQLLWSRFIYGVLFGLGQLMALFVTGRLLYGVDVFGHLGNLLLVCASVAAACTAFGMLLSAVTRSADAARSLATLLVITMSACGGAWFPVSFMPHFMQQLAHFTIVYWAIEGFGAVLWAGSSLAQMLPVLGVLLAISAAAMALAVWRFNRSNLFG
jgi:ABC-2 type transport system permease protein